MKVKVISIKGKATANEVSLSKNIFSVEPNDHAIYLDVKQHLANRRQGTHKTKERAEINGSTKKIRKQKGTGSARVGSIKSGTRVGGGRIFGPRPRNYQFKLNLKLKRLARKSAFSYKASSKDIMVIKDFNFDKIKTKDFETLLFDLGIQNEKVLMILGDKNDNIYLSSRNLKRVKVVTADTVNTFDLLNATKVVMLESSVKIIENILN
ncbi:MAG: 50S ribosomal protein L4 [Crocinitomicaceae bacterium]|nr:50S ribosomal protein L4 [Crocinitomicaceae bacterium]|tara:strand:- start:12595 stop:13221 length:627 start_codon:yes stop_codon:yes gene_type:complete